LFITIVDSQDQDVPGAFGGIPKGARSTEGCENNADLERAETNIAIENLSVATFLDSIGLSCLQDIFDKEQITMDILVEMGHDELKDIGISAYGHRHKILKRLERLTVIGRCYLMSSLPGIFEWLAF
jgi:tankyrase